MKLGIIGTGNLSEAMVKIFLKTRLLTGESISVYDTNPANLNYWAGTYDVMPCTDLETLVQNSEIIFVSVSSNEFVKFIANVDHLLKTYKPLIVSMTSGKSLEEIEDTMDFIAPMARVVTNTNASVGQAIVAYCFNELATDDQKGILIELLSAMGQLIEIDESAFDMFEAMSATMNAFTCSLMDTLIECSVQAGLPRDIAKQTALACASGVSKCLSNTGAPISNYLDTLCVPQSVSGAAMLALKENGFDKAVIRGFQAAKA